MNRRSNRSKSKNGKSSSKRILGRNIDWRRSSRSKKRKWSRNISMSVSRIRRRSIIKCIIMSRS